MDDEEEEEEVRLQERLSVGRVQRACWPGWG